jgi:hypothetical protein
MPLGNPFGKKGTFEGALLVVTVALPACLAVSHAANGADAAHDEAVVRALGLGWAGAFRALDAVWCGLFEWLPVGTRALRGALASGAACGVAAGLLFVLAREVLARCEGTVSRSRFEPTAKPDDETAEGEGTARIGPVVAAIVALAATLSPSWQLEATAPGGATFGTVLALLPAAILLRASRLAPERVRSWVALTGLALGTAVAYEPLVGASALASVLAYVGLTEGGERRSLFAEGSNGGFFRGALAFAGGLVPFGLALARRGSPLALNVAVVAGLVGERGESRAGMPVALLREDVGVTTSLLALAGLVLAALVVRARPALAALVALAIGGGIAMGLGAPAGPTRYGAPVLAGIGAAYALAGVAMQTVVQAVARAKVPFARASAAMILILEAALAARAADDSSARADDRAKGASEAWDEAAWGALPAGAVILIRDPRVETRLYAARATGELRGDLALVPLFDLGGHGALRELARDPKLAPIWRDAALLGAEEEWSLSSLAQERPLVAAYDPAWDRTLARHLVPVGLFARFEPEPRGGSDRRRALDAFSPSVNPPVSPAGAVLPSPRDRLAKGIDGDPELLGLTARLLRGRVIALAAASERDVVAHALDDLRPFSPRDTVAAELVRRMAASRGAIDVKDLTP